MFVLVGGLLFMAFLNFTVLNESSEKYPESLPIEFIEIFENDFVKTVDNKVLINSLEENFSSLFDEIKRVDVQLNSDFGYAYLVIGTKDLKEKVEILKIEKADVENETYTYIDFKNIDTKNAIQFCTTGPNISSNPFVCTGSCRFRNERCLGLICGISSGSGCS